MILLSQEELNNIIEKEYPDADNKILSTKLGIKEETLRSKASKLGVKKSESFMKDYYETLQKNRKLKQEENYKDYKMTNIEKNIIIGSLLGDGTLSKYGRSLNACYRENTGPTQVPYRKWKSDRLSNLDFKSNAQGAIYSPSHPIYTELYELFYPNGIKILPKAGLDMLNHPIGLACLFMDDGSLIASGSTSSNTITIYSSVYIYSQSFTKEEELKIVEMINYGFNYKDIAESIGRTYYGLYDKVRRMKIE